MVSRVRPYEPGDEAAVLALINADRIAGQPRCGAAGLGEALAGRSVIDAGWWTELALPPRTEVLADAKGTVLGVVSYAVRPDDEAGMVLWLHGQEDPSVVRVLLARAIDQLGPTRTVYAFEVASALTMGLEGLPVGHRPTTHRALTEAGFAGRDLWRYMRRSLPGTGLRADADIVATECDDPSGWRLEVRQDGEVAATANVGSVVDGIGVLWWIGVELAYRGRGLGRSVLGRALALLDEQGAQEVILYVDDDDPEGDRDRTAANHLYDAAGFVEVDRLYSYTKSPRGVPVPAGHPNE